jgi:hypothetical protein
MAWTALPFSEHRGKTLPQIILDDTHWFFWILPKLYRQLKLEVDDLARKASKIKIPRRNPRKWCVVIVLNTIDFADLTLSVRTAS